MKQKFLTRSLATLMMAATLIFPTFADTSPTWQVTQDGTRDCIVYAEVGSSFEVQLPKEITLDGTTKEATYQIPAVTGDISGDEFIVVAPANTFIMQQAGKPDVTAEITQDIISFRDNTYTGELIEGFALMQDGATGTIKAPGLTAGLWEGTFDFEINLVNENEVV